MYYVFCCCMIATCETSTVEQIAVKILTLDWLTQYFCPKIYIYIPFYKSFEYQRLTGYEFKQGI